MNWRTAIRRALENPSFALEVGLSLVRGEYYRLKFRLLRRRVVIGRRFRVVGRLDIRGPGTVIFGDDCSVVSTYMRPTTPYTYAKEAVIRFGDRVLLTGTQLGCAKLIEVEDDAGLSDARVMDTDFHSPAITDRHKTSNPGASKPVHIGRNVWVGAGAFLLKGSRIGANAVVSAGSVVVGEVPPNSIVLGNPARVTWRLAAADPAVPAPAPSPAETPTAALV